MQFVKPLRQIVICDLGICKNKFDRLIDWFLTKASALLKGDKIKLRGLEMINGKGEREKNVCLLCNDIFFPFF